MTIDLNRLPYFDDYDEEKNFHRILFKPGLAVQARELTQLQTILQNQVERFGDHVFENGSRVLGGTFDPQDPVDYVRVKSNINDLPDIEGKELIGSVTNLKARVLFAVADPAEANRSVLYISYTDSNNSEVVTSFTNETLTYFQNNISVSLSTATSNITGKGSLFGITEGVLYVSGFFVKFEKQKTVLDHFKSKANKRVYFKAQFSTVDSFEDRSLLDNAQGFNNFNAPGADRLRCELTLITSDLDVDLGDDDSFLLLEIRNGEVYKKNERTIYNEVADELAKRTFDESGDYVVRGWDVYTREHLNTGVNGGKYSAAEGGDETKFVVELEKGLAYAKGYEIETLSTRTIPVDKATGYTFVDDQYGFVSSGPHVVINEIMGVPDPDSFVELSLYDTAETRISLAISSSTAPSGTQIGTARLVSYVEDSGQFGQADATVRLYISNVQMNSGKTFADVRGIGNSDFFADVYTRDDEAVLFDPLNNSKLVYVGNSHVRTVKDESGNSDLSLTFMKQDSGAISTSGTISGIVNLAANETLSYGSGTLGAIGKESLFLTVTATGTVSLAGSVSVTSGSPTVTGTSTTFFNLNVGDRLSIDSQLYIIESIESNTSLTLESNASTTYSGSFTKQYVVGDIIDLNSIGATSGAARSVTTTSTSISIDLGESFSASTSCKLSYRAVRSNASEIKKNLRSTRYVKVDGSTAPELSRFYLGVPDVHKITQIRKHTSAITSTSEGVDVTDDYILVKNDTGTSYNISYIISNVPLTASEHLLIEFDYFEPENATSGLYFSIDSYPVDDSIVSSTTIKTVDLSSFQRNYIDMRPFKVKSATPSSTISTAPTNPTNSSTFDIATEGLRAGVPGTNVIFDYSYYLARRDILVVTTRGEFKVISGRHAVIPPFPKVPESYMPIANIFIRPYPSISQNYAKILNREEDRIITEKMTFSRHTMRDIGAIKQRVKNLEYYNALNLLEKNTLDLTISDENGLDRFKNGAFINPFVDHSLSDTDHPDYNIAVDRKSKNIRPAFDLQGFENNYFDGTNVQKSGSLVHLPFTEKTLKENLFATTTRNIELSSYRYIGDIDLYPDIDTWVDTSTVDKNFDIGNDVEEGKLLSTEYGAWQTTSSGAVSGTNTNEYKVYHRDFGDMTFDGNEKLLKTFSTADEALKYLFSRTQAGAAGLAELKNKFGDDYDITDPVVQNYIDSQAYETNWSRTTGRHFITYGGEVTTTEKILQQRTNVETIVSSETESYELGEFVTDASLIPYIRPQTIKLYVHGLKPNTRFHVFFDAENMNTYSTPVSISSYFNSSTNTNSGYMDFDTDLSGVGEEGDKIYSNANGEALVFLRLPAGVDKRFRVGEKEVIVTDNPTNDPAASSYARATFVASGLNLQKQNTILSTKTASTETREVTETQEKTITRTDSTANGWFETGPSCAAYSVYVDEEETVDGVFLSSVDIWLSALHPKLGVWFEIREMSPDGGITRNTLPYSTVWMNRNDPRLKISTDGITNATKVNFKSPVFLYNRTQYAFVIHTEGLNPDTYFWVSRLGDTDVVTNNPVTSRGLFGTFYTTNNNLNWDIVPDIDLKIRFNRMSTGATEAAPVSGTAEFTIEDVEFIKSSASLPAVFFNDGEPIRGSEILNLSIISGDPVQIGDTIEDLTTGSTGEIVDIQGTDIYTNGFDFLEGEGVTVYMGATATVRNTSTVTTVHFGVGLIDKIDRPTNRFDIIYSNGKFFQNAVLRSILPTRHKSTLNGTGISVTYDGAESTLPNPYAPTGVITLPVGMATSSTTDVPEYTITGFEVYEYCTTTIRPSYLEFGDSASVSFYTINSEGTALGTASEIYPNSEVEHRTVKNILSRSEEVRLLNGDKSFKINVNLTTNSEYLSPIVDASLMGSVFTLNQLNNDTADETKNIGGALESKYISRIIELSQENAAEDLKVILQEYRPSSTDVKIWAKIKSNSDSEDIRVKGWFELVASKSAISSDSNKENYIDTTYSIPSSMLTGQGGEVQYTLSGNLAAFSASEMVNGTEYVIHDVGTTDFTAVGASSNTIGEVFTATGPAEGTGLVSFGSDVIYTRYTEFQLKIGMLGSNRAIYPKASQLRAIALQI